MNSAEIVPALQSALPAAITGQTEFRGELTLQTTATSIRELCLLLRDTHGFDSLLDISSVDNFGDEPRFEMVYELYSMPHNRHLRLKYTVSEDVADEVPSVTDIWPTANWHEREIYDMMGLKFPAHPDLRRILMWDGYPYFPLRKDFPLEGKPSEVEEVAFTGVAPLEGGPFVTAPGAGTTQQSEPRARLV